MKIGEECKYKLTFQGAVKTGSEACKRCIYFKGIELNKVKCEKLN